MDFWDENLRAKVHALIPQLEGKPCLNVDGHNGRVHRCRRISQLETNEDSLEGVCDWVEPADARPDELTDGLAISCDCIRLGPGWLLDTYFDWYLVFDPALVARSFAGDHSWVGPFLDSGRCP